MTKSPGEKPFTAEPNECTCPTPSEPPTAGTCCLTGYTPIMHMIRNNEAKLTVFCICLCRSNQHYAVQIKHKIKLPIH